MTNPIHEHVLSFLRSETRILLPRPLSWSSRISDYYRVAALQKIFRSIQGDVLDFGCGEKPYQSILSNGSVRTWVGVDLEKRTTGPASPNKADLFFTEGKIPAADRAFDAVIATQVLEHVGDLPGALAEISRVTKIHGKIIITVPMTGHLHEEPHDYRRFTTHGLWSDAAPFSLSPVRTIALGGPVSVITTLLANQLNFLSRVPVLGGLIHSLTVGVVTQSGFTFERLLFKAGYRKALISTDLLFVFEKRA